MTEAVHAGISPAASDSSAPVAAENQTPSKLSLGGLAWALFEGARNPYVILVTIYVFMPYFSTVVVGDPVRGQAAVAAYALYVGFIVAPTAPLLGASIDKLGRRKPWLFLCVAGMVPLIWALWWTRPDRSGLSVNAVIVIATVINVLFAYSEVLLNSLLVRAAGLKNVHKASGLALSLSNFLAVTALIFIMWAFALPGKVPWSFLPHAPLFGLDPAQHEPDRIVGPISALIFIIGAIPMFLFTPDADRSRVPVLHAFKDGVMQLWSMVKRLKDHRDAAIFLGSRMLYVDGMTAILFFAGVYAAGVMKWGALEMLAYGVSLSVFAVAGGFIGGALDHWLGPKRAVQIELLVTLVGIAGMLGMAPDRIFYFWAYDASAHPPLWNGPLFRTLPEALYIFIGFFNAIFITAQYASSRTLLTRLTPPDQTGVFFGLYALSGTVTLFLGSTLVHVATEVFHSQQIGFSMTALLLALGFIGLSFVRGGGREA